MYDYFAYAGGTFVIDEDASSLCKRLEDGSTVHGRIVLCLGEGKYLLRIKGRNIVMRSELAFERQQEIELQVRKSGSRMILIPTTRSDNASNGRMDIRA